MKQLFSDVTLIKQKQQNLTKTTSTPPKQLLLLDLSFFVEFV